MQQLVSTQQQQMSTREYWTAYLEKHQTQAMLLSTLGSVLSFFLNGHFIVVAARWVIRVGGYIAESALLFAVLWITLTSVAPKLVELFMSSDLMQYLVWLALVTLALIPEVILGNAIINSIVHWKRAFERKNFIAFTWAGLFTLPTLFFLILTGITINMLAASDGNLIQATTSLVGFRCFTGWTYGLLQLVYAGVGKLTLQEQAQTVLISMEDYQQKLNECLQEISSLKAQFAPLQTGKNEVVSEANSVQKSEQIVTASGTKTEQKIQGDLERVPSPILNEKLEKAMEILRQNPHISDEDLAPHLNLRRPASARFWRLKAMELLSRNGEKNTDPQLPIIKPKITQKLPELVQDPPQLTKYLYSKDEAAEMAKVNVRAIEKAVKSGALLTAKNNPDQVRRSSLEKFMAQRKKTKRIHEQIAHHRAS